MNRAQTGNFEFPRPLNFATELAYFSYDPKEWMETENYFLSAQGFLNDGDEICTAARLEDGTWFKARFEVQVSKPGQVVVKRLGPWRQGGMAEDEQRSEASGAFERLNYVSEDCRAKYRGKAGWGVIGIASGTLYATGLTKEEAIAIANGDQPLPKGTEPVVPEGEPAAAERVEAVT